MELQEERISVERSQRVYKLNNEADYFGGYYFRFITFNNIPNQDKLTQINEAGIQLMEYVPDNTYLSAIPNSISVISLNSLEIV